MTKETVKKWIAKAESDLITAKNELKVEYPMTDAICFHAQQCAEKYLKAFLVFHDKYIFRTHDIGFLVKECALLDSEFNTLLDEGIDQLTEYAVHIRYPDEFYFPSIEDAENAIRKAEKVKEVVIKSLEKMGFQVNPEKILKEVRDELSQK